MIKTTDSWFLRARSCIRVDINVFCFPFAGGAASVYRNWGNLLPPTIQIIPVELPGRGGRLHEPPFVDLPALIAVLADAIQPLLGSPFALFGHSMGALLAFELTRELSRVYAREPELLVVSGCRAPQVPDDFPVIYNLPQSEFIKALNQLDGTPKEILEHAELMDLVLPLLRTDFQLVQTHKYIAGPRLRCPITAYGGLQDSHSTCDVILPWRELTSSRFTLHLLPGGHFLPRSSQTLLLDSLARELREVIARLRVNHS
jgi:medium-chain acyl-[acyl-carrier-protein] hydrolase